jgi:NAD+ diphosphatase
MNNHAGSLYLFQENNLVAEAACSGGELQNGVSPDSLDPSLRDGCIDEYEVPALDGSGPIGGMFLSAAAALPPAWKKIPMRQAVNLIAEGAMADGFGPLGRLLRVYHIGQWRRESLYCGSCGARNEDAPSEELARQCPRCGRLEFPRISPAVITIIINDREEALLAHNIKFAPGVYSLIAGFNEAGESLEATVAREIKEEINLDVRDIRYVKSQPWPFPNSLMLGFSARHAGGEPKPDGVEIEDAQWFRRDKLPLLPGSGSVSRYLIQLWLEGRL